MNDSARIEMFTPEVLASLQTTFFNNVKQEGHKLGILIEFNNVNSPDGFNFKTTMEGKLITDEAQKALDRKMREHLKVNDLKLGDESIIYDRPWKVSGFDTTKYRRTVELTNDNGKKIFAAVDVVHSGIALAKAMVAKKKRRATPKTDDPAKPAKKTRTPVKKTSAVETPATTEGDQVTA